MNALEERGDVDARLLSQVLAFLLLLLCSLAENGLGYFPALYGSVPKLTLIVLFVLYYYHPQTLPLLPVVVVGLVHDVIQANPVGYTSGLMLVAHGWVEMRRQTMAQAESASVWYEFTKMMAAISLLMLFALVLYTGQVPAIQPLVFQLSLTVLIFPVVNWIHYIIGSIVALLEMER